MLLDCGQMVDAFVVSEGLVVICNEAANFSFTEVVDRGEPKMAIEKQISSFLLSESRDDQRFDDSDLGD
jgi:hypothetical protein